MRPAGSSSRARCSASGWRSPGPAPPTSSPSASVTVLLAPRSSSKPGCSRRASRPDREIQERYVFYAAPLLVLSFALYACRGWPLRLPHLALAAGLVLISVRLPLSGYAVALDVQRLADPLRRLLADRQARHARRRLRSDRRGGRADDARRRARLETPAARHARRPRPRPARNRRRLGRGAVIFDVQNTGSGEESLPAGGSLLGRPGAARRRDAAPVVQRGPWNHASGALLEPLDHAGRAPPRRSQVRLRSVPSASGWPTTAR